MHLLIALLLLDGTDPLSEGWRILLADHTGAYWVDAATGKVSLDPSMRRAKRKAIKPNPDTQLAPPRTPMKRYRNASVTTAKGITIRMLKNRMRLESGDQLVWLTKAGEGIRPVMRPDAKAFAFHRWSGPLVGKSRKAHLVVRDLVTNKERILVKDAHLQEAAWSPDGKTLAVSTYEELAIYDVASGKRTYHRKVRDINDDLYAHAPQGMLWGPFGKRLAMRIVFLGGRMRVDGEFDEIYGDRHLFVLDVETKKIRIHKLPKSTCEGPIRSELRSGKK